MKSNHKFQNIYRNEDSILDDASHLSYKLTHRIMFGKLDVSNKHENFLCACRFTDVRWTFGHYLLTSKRCNTNTKYLNETCNIYTFLLLI